MVKKISMLSCVYQAWNRTGRYAACWSSPVEFLEVIGFCRFCTIFFYRFSLPESLFFAIFLDFDHVNHYVWMYVELGKIFLTKKNLSKLARTTSFSCCMSSWVGSNNFSCKNWGWLITVLNGPVFYRLHSVGEPACFPSVFISILPVSAKNINRPVPVDPVWS